MDSETVSATEFKAKCLDLLDQVGARQIGRLEITKHGKIVAVLIPPPSREEAVQQLHGFLQGSVLVPKGLDRPHRCWTSHSMPNWEDCTNDWRTHGLVAGHLRGDLVGER